MIEFAGFGAAVVGAGWIMLKYLLGRLDKQDEYIKTLTTNHIAHSTQAMTDMTRVAEAVLIELKKRPPN
jgi:hypothetical protein